MESRRDRYNDETRSQHSIGRRSVGTANTARSALDLDRALTQVYSQYGGNDAQNEEIAATLYEAGLANYEEKNFSKAPDHFALALSMYSALQAESSEEDLFETEIANIHKMLGMVYLARQELHKVRHNYQKASKELMKARDNFEEALTKKSEIYGETTNTDLAELRRYLGLTYITDTSSTEDMEFAIFHLAEALTDFKTIYGEDAVHVDIADTYWHLGCTYQQQKNYDRARAQFTAALGMFQEVYSDPNHVKIAEAYYKIGCTYLAVGNYDKAISSFSQSLDIYTEIRETNLTIDLNYVELCFHLGKTYVVLGDFESAKPHLDTALLSYQALYLISQPNHPSLQAVLEAVAENDKKRSEQCDAAHMPSSGRAREEIAQTTVLPEASVNPTGLSLKSEAKQQGSMKMVSHTESKQEHPPSSLSSSKFGVFASAPPAPTNSKKAPTVREIKAIYVSKAGFFLNASTSIFVTENLEETIQALRARAGKGKRGASYATLEHFGYSLN